MACSSQYLSGRSGRSVALVEDPHHAGEETVAPVGPDLALVFPVALDGVHGIEARMSFDQLAHLLLREPERVFEQFTVRFKDKLNHALWILDRSATIATWRQRKSR